MEISSAELKTPQTFFWETCGACGAERGDPEQPPLMSPSLLHCWSITVSWENNPHCLSAGLISSSSSMLWVCGCVWYGVWESLCLWAGLMFNSSSFDSPQSSFQNASLYISVWNLICSESAHFTSLSNCSWNLLLSPSLFLIHFFQEEACRKRR